MSMYRANVLQFLALQTDVNGVPTGRRVVNDADLQARGLPPHTVKLPKFGTGNVVPESAGATLVVFFRDPDEAAAQDRPVRRHLRPASRGRDDGAAPGVLTDRPSRRTRPSRTSRRAGRRTRPIACCFNGGVIATDAFPDSLNAASERAWANPTDNVSARMPGTQLGEYGEAGSQRRTAAGPDSHGRELGPPGLSARAERNVGAARHALRLGTRRAGRQRRSQSPPVAPGPEDGRRRVQERPPANPDGSTGIRAHFDVGGLDAYRSRGVVLHTDWDDDTSTDADEYLVPSRLARGGELIQERACVPRVNGRVDGRQPTPAAKGGTTAPTRWSPATTASR